MPHVEEWLKGEPAEPENTLTRHKVLSHKSFLLVLSSSSGVDFTAERNKREIIVLKLQSKGHLIQSIKLWPSSLSNMDVSEITSFFTQSLFFWPFNVTSCLMASAVSADEALNHWSLSQNSLCEILIHRETLQSTNSIVQHSPNSTHLKSSQPMIFLLI